MVFIVCVYTCLYEHLDYKEQQRKQAIANPYTRPFSFCVAWNKHTPTSSGPAPPPTRKRYAIAWWLTEPGSERTMGKKKRKNQSPVQTGSRRYLFPLPTNPREGVTQRGTAHCTSRPWAVKSPLSRSPALSSSDCVYSASSAVLNVTILK